MTAWSADDVADALGLAARASAALPNVGTWPSTGGRSCLDDGIAPSRSRSLTPAQVDEAELVLRWLSVIDDPTVRRIVGWRARGITWRPLGEYVGMTAMGALKAHRRGCTAIARALNTGKLKAPKQFHLAA